MDYALYERALNDEGIPPIEKGLLLYIIFRSHADSGLCYFSQKKAAKQLGFGRQRVSEATVWLRNHGYLRTNSEKGSILTFDLSPWATTPVAFDDNPCRPGRHRTSIEQAKNSFPPKRVPDPEEPLTPEMQAVRERLFSQERRNVPEQLLAIRKKLKQFGAA